MSAIRATHPPHIKCESESYFWVAKIGNTYRDGGFELSQGRLADLAHSNVMSPKSHTTCTCTNIEFSELDEHHRNQDRPDTCTSKTGIGDCNHSDSSKPKMRANWLTALRQATADSHSKDESWYMFTSSVLRYGHIAHKGVSIILPSLASVQSIACNQRRQPSDP